MNSLSLTVGLILIIVFPHSSKDTTNPPQKITTPVLQILIDSARVTGVILVYNPQTDTYYSNNFAAAEQGHLPASTYKIPNSIIALEAGVVENDSTLFPWDGEERAMDRWEQDLLFRDAFRLSCVPCYQEVARTIGAERMNDYLQQLDYGTMVVDTGNIDQLWLVGNSRISPRQQVDFLQRFYDAQLPISPRTEAIVKRMMVVEDKDTYRLSGKTGLSNDGGAYNGWFVGYVETSDNVHFFATNLQPTNSLAIDQLIASRVEISIQALEVLNIIE